MNDVMATAAFASFQRRLELGPHNQVHRWVGGTMSRTTSAADPLFWLHHGFVDNLWARWQAGHHGADAEPANQGVRLEEPPIMSGTVGTILRIEDLGYTYA